MTAGARWAGLAAFLALWQVLALAGGGWLVAGPLGSFVVWRRMAYFGDSTAHAAILGVAMALAFEVSIYAGTLAVAVAMACLVSALVTRGQAMDTILGVLSHSALAVGLVAVRAGGASTPSTAVMSWPAASYWSVWVRTMTFAGTRSTDPSG